MPTGFDTTENAGGQATAIRSQGYDFVGRYLSEFPWKTIMPAEAAVLKAAGLAVLLVYEDGPNGVDYFIPGRGSQDCARAISQARALDAPAGTAVYFAVDYDATVADIDGRISAYFQEIATAMANDPSGFVVGVYGSGQTCATLCGAGLARYSWLAQSSEWAGYALPGPWSIRQGQSSIVCTLKADLDTTG